MDGCRAGRLEEPRQLIVPYTRNVPVEQVIGAPRDSVSTTTMIHDIELPLPIITSGFDFDRSGELNLEFARNMYSSGGLHIFSSEVPFYDRAEALEELGEEGSEYGIEVTPMEFYTNRSTLENLPSFISIAPSGNGMVPLVEGWSGRYPLIVGNIASVEMSGFKTADYVAYRCGLGLGRERRLLRQTGVGFNHTELLRGLRNRGMVLISDTDYTATYPDVVASLGLGASAVWANNFFVASQESSCELVMVDNQWYKMYYVGKELIRVAYEEKSIFDIMTEISDALESAMRYTDSATLEEFQTNVGDTCEL